MYERRRKADGFRRSEGLFRVKETKKDQKKEGITGCEYSGGSHREDRRIREILRLENSYGNIAFGSGPEKEMTILVSEKRRFDQPNITGREKKLRESRQIRRPVGRGKVYANSGDRSKGAVAFRYDRGLSPAMMLGKMQDYAARFDQETLRQTVPFLSAGPEKEKRKNLGEKARALREKDRRTEADGLELERTRLDREIQEKEQAERKLRQKLASAVERMKKEAFPSRAELMRRQPAVAPEAKEQRETGEQDETPQETEAAAGETGEEISDAPERRKK